MSYNSGCLVYCIFLLLGISVAQEPYYESNEYMTWKNAKPTCRMATPDIEYVDLSVKIRQNLKSNHLWLGYYRARIGFEYFGCVKNESVKSTNTIHTEMNSPGHCYSACGKSVQNIGLKDRECFCLDAMEPDPISESSCNLSCPAPSLNIACGGKFHLSLYSRINPNDVSAAVGASVAAVLVIALVVVFVILRKRKKIPELCKATASSKDSNNHNVDTKTFDNFDEKTNVHHSYDHIGGSFHQENADSNAAPSSIDNYHTHTYLIIEKHEKENDNANDTYNLAGAGNQTHDEDRNDYNHVKIDNNETYDHAYNQSKEKMETSNETYDTAEKAAMKLKTRVTKTFDKFGGTDEDAYNHINGKLQKNSATDHVYGVPCQPETDTGDIGNLNPQKEFQDGDTYSHISNKPPKSNKADNVYGVPSHLNAPPEID